MQKQLTIPSGQSLTAGVDLGGDYIASIFMPAAWDAAPLTVEGSINGQDYLPCYDAGGELLSITVDVNRLVVLSEDATAGIRYVRFRSGAPGAPINQTADRVMVVEVADS